MLTRSHARHGGPRLRPTVSAILAALLLGSCTKPAAPPLPPPPAVEAPPPTPPPRPVLHAGWSFQTGPSVCVAVAAAGHIRLLVAVRRSGPVRITVTVPLDVSGRPVAHFRGPAGAWSLTGWKAGKREFGFNLPRSVDSLSHVLILLSGGTMDLESQGEAIPRLDLAASGADGQRWFTCARRLVIGV